MDGADAGDLAYRLNVMSAAAAARATGRTLPAILGLGLGNHLSLATEGVLHWSEREQAWMRNR